MDTQHQIRSVLKDKSNKLFFLKAILLGIQYGQSNKVNHHKQYIENEIQKLERPITQSQQRPLSSTQPISDLQLKTNFSIKKYQDILQKLEAQRITIQSQIANISQSSYSRTLSFQQNQQNQQFVHRLRAQLLIIHKEMEKYTLLLNNVGKMNQNLIVSPQPSTIRNYPQQSQSTLSQQQPHYQINNDNHNYQDNQQDNNNENEDENDNFIEELQKTFGSLSSLLSNP
jgi:hypothetical protein